MKIHSVKKEDRGTYFCVADNGVGKPAKRNVALAVSSYILIIRINFKWKIKTIQGKDKINIASQNANAQLFINSDRETIFSHSYLYIDIIDKDNNITV